MLICRHSVFLNSTRKMDESAASTPWGRRIFEWGACCCSHSSLWEACCPHSNSIILASCILESLVYWCWLLLSHLISTLPHAKSTGPSSKAISAMPVAMNWPLYQLLCKGLGYATVGIWRPKTSIIALYATPSVILGWVHTPISSQVCYVSISNILGSLYILYIFKRDAMNRMSL